MPADTFHRILLIEDHDNQRRTLTALLASEGFEVVSCPDTATALDHLASERFGAIILDLKLSGTMSGLQLFDQLRAREEAPPIIVYTGHGSFDSAKHAVNVQAFAYVEKGADPTELLQAVHRATERARQHHIARLQATIHQQQALLQEHNARFRRYFELGVVGMAAVAPDQRFLDVNTRLCDMLALSRESLLAKTWVDLVIPEQRSLAASLCPASCHGTTAGFAKEFSLRRGDGITLPVLLAKKCLLRSDGSVDSCLALFQDLSEIKRATAELEQREQELRAIVDSAMDAIITLDERGRVMVWNPAAERLFGYSTEEARGQDLGDLIIPARSRPVHQRALEQAARAGILAIAHGPTEFEVRHKDGHEFPVRLSLSMWYAGSTPRFTGILQDLTRQRQLETQLFHSQKMEAIGTLAGGIAHDFNNILAAILGFTELALIQTPEENQLLRSQLTEIEQAGFRARDLIKQILTFSRVHETERRPLNIATVAKEVLRFIRATFPATITIHARFDSDPVILADATQMHQILMNLCANAEYAMRQTGGHLEIALETATVSAEQAHLHPELREGKYAKLTIRDTGPGIPDDVLTRIFEPFFTTKAPGEGTGLGLAVVHGIVRGHDGAILVDSRVGKGTSFDIYLPIASQEFDSEPSQTLRDCPRGHECLLFVDDEPSLAHFAQEFLAHLGYRIVCTTSPREALDLFTADPDRFDLLITDQTMPDMTGEQLALAVRRIRWTIPVILCTGFSHTMTPEKARELGIQELVLKPTPPAHLAQTIRRILDHRQRKEENPDGQDSRG